jgi:HTH-type transcriptional regulator / antitoxin HipB
LLTERALEEVLVEMRVESFGSALRHYRKLRGLSQVELCERTGLKQGVISRYENLISAPNSRSNLEVLAGALDVPLNDLRAGIVRNGPGDNEDESQRGVATQRGCTEEELMRAIPAFAEHPELMLLLSEGWNYLSPNTKEILVGWLTFQVQLNNSPGGPDVVGAYMRNRRSAEE